MEVVNNRVEPFPVITEPMFDQLVKSELDWTWYGTELALAQLTVMLWFVRTTLAFKVGSVAQKAVREGRNVAAARIHDK